MKAKFYQIYEKFCDAYNEHRVSHNALMFLGYLTGFIYGLNYHDFWLIIKTFF